MPARGHIVANADMTLTVIFETATDRSGRVEIRIGESSEADDYFEVAHRS